MGAMQGRKGGVIEREIVVLHQNAGVPAERVPLSGAAHFQGRNHDVEIGGKIPLRIEVKARKNGEGFKTLENWLGAHDALALRRNRAEPLMLLTWATYERLLKAANGQTV